MTSLASENTAGSQGVGAFEMGAFQPHPLLRGFHRMTFASMFIRMDVKEPVPAVEERLFRVDAETQVLGLCSWQREPAPVVVVVHGFAGHADRPYMRGAVRKAFVAGFHVVRLNMRNCGGTEHLAGSMYHAGLVDDLAAVVKSLEKDPLCTGIHMAGFSMGGNVVLRLGGLWGHAVPSSVASIIAVSPVIDLAHCAANLDEQRGLRVYRNSFLRRLKATYARRAKLFPDRYDVRRLQGVGSLRAFDEQVTAPDCGFSSVDEYYQGASCRWKLGALRVPSLVLHALDDLLVPYPDDQLEVLEAAPAVRLQRSAYGGHCAFMGPRALGLDSDRYWAENRLVEYMDWIERRTLGEEM